MCPVEEEYKWRIQALREYVTEHPQTPQLIEHRVLAALQQARAEGWTAERTATAIRSAWAVRALCLSSVCHDTSVQQHASVAAIHNAVQLRRRVHLASLHHRVWHASRFILETLRV